jgi:hypothetical protein
VPRPFVARQKGFEPLTRGLEGRCSSPSELLARWSGRLDSNQRPPAPKAGALPGCATPRLRNVPQLLNPLKRLRQAAANPLLYQRRKR